MKREKTKREERPVTILEVSKSDYLITVPTTTSYLSLAEPTTGNGPQTNPSYGCLASRRAERASEGPGLTGVGVGVSSTCSLHHANSQTPAGLRQGSQLPIQERAILTNYYYRLSAVRSTTHSHCHSLTENAPLSYLSRLGQTVRIEGSRRILWW